MPKELLDVPVSFKLSKSQFEPYKKIIEKTGTKKSKLMREVFISKSGDILLSDHVTKDNKRVVFLSNKTSNNINQIARQLNSSFKKGVVKEETYTKILNQLISIEASFSKAIDQC